LLGFLPPPSFPPPFPPPLTFLAVSTMMVSAATLQSITPAEFGALMVTVLSEQVGGAPSDDVTVMVMEGVDVQMETGGLVGAELLAVVPSAACNCMVGSCSVTQGRRQRRLEHDYVRAHAPPSRGAVGDGWRRDAAGKPPTTSGHDDVRGVEKI